MIRRLLNQWLDNLMLPLFKTLDRGYSKRLGTYRPAGPVDLGGLFAIPEPQTLTRRPEPIWRGWRVERFEFPSPGPSYHPSNQTVHGLLLYARKNAPWAVVAPGFATGAFPRNSYWLFQDLQGEALLERGLNVALIDLPYHRLRKRPGTLAGEGFFSPNLEQTQTAVLQGAADLIALCRWLMNRFPGPLGLWGTSLGGCITGLVTTILPNLGAVVLMEPLDNPGDVMSVLPGAWEIRSELSRCGVPLAVMPEVMAPLAPSSYLPRTAIRRILFVIPLWDHIVPTRFQIRFWEAWGQPERILWPAGHIMTPLKPAVNNAAADFLAQHLLEGA